MSAPTLKVTEEKPDPNQVSVCTLLDKSAVSRNVFTEEECDRIIKMGRTWEEIDAEKFFMGTFLFKDERSI